MNSATSTRLAAPARSGGRDNQTRSASDDAALKLWVVLSRAYQAVSHHAEADIARSGLIPSEFAILEALYHKGPLLLGELQQKILVTSGGVTYLVDRLTAKGLVERRDCPNDRRARYAALTPAGEKLVRSIFPDHAKAIAKAVSGLTRTEQRDATELLKALGTRAAASAPEG